MKRRSSTPRLTSGRVRLRPGLFEAHSPHCIQFSVVPDTPVRTSSLEHGGKPFPLSPRYQRAITNRRGFEYNCQILPRGGSFSDVILDIR
jgi:hypothetical protein